MSRLISKMSTMKKETNIKVEFITFYKFCVTETKMIKNTKPKKAHRKYKAIKCDCGNKIDVDLCLELEDYDYIGRDKSQISIYCDVCGENHLVKL